MGAPDECWEWQRAVNPVNRYGYFRVAKGVMVSAHRYAYKATHDVTLEPKQLVLHKCDNRRCCNPAHLYVGDHKQNAKDMMDRGRHRHGEWFGEDHHSARVTWDDVRRIRENQVGWRDVGEVLGLSKTQFYRIKRGESWVKHGPN